MALATQCPHCHTTFRVAADQLKLRGGIVRCGACQGVFDGNAHLVDLEARVAAPAAFASPPASPPAVPADDAAAPPRETPEDTASEPVHTLDFTHTFDPFGILPGVAAQAGAQPAPEPAFEAEPASEPAPLSSHSMPAPAAPFAPGGPQVWRSARRPASEADFEPASEPAFQPDAELDAAPDTGADAAPLQPDAAAAAVADPGAALAAAAGVPLETAERAPSGSAQPSYAPSGRIEPRLEPLPDADAGAAAETEAAPDTLAEAAASGIDPAATPAPDAPAPSFVPRARIMPQPAVAAAANAVSAAEPEPAPPPAAQERIEPGFGLPVDEEIVAQALPHDDNDDRDDRSHHDPNEQPAPPPTPPAVPVQAAPGDGIAAAALPLRASASATGEAPTPAAQAAMAAATTAAAAKSARTRSLDARTRRSNLKLTKIEPPKLRLPQEDADEPEFVRRSRRQERFVRTRRTLMGIGAAVLLLALAAQLILSFRNGMAARNPLLKPGLETACAALGCRVELPAQAGNLAIETGELATLGPDTYSLNTLLRNQGTLVQAWPSIELELTDADNKPVLRRVFGPADYLPPGVSAASGFGPRSEQAIRLHFALSELKPSDYHLFVFYP